LNKRRRYDDAGVCCCLGVVVSFDALAALRAACVQLRRNSLLAVACEGRGEGVAEPVQRVFKERLLVSGTVCRRAEYDEPDQPIHWYWNSCLSIMLIVIKPKNRPDRAT